MTQKKEICMAKQIKMCIILYRGTQLSRCNGCVWNYGDSL